MNEHQRNELKKFADLQAKGRGYIIELHYPFHLPEQVLGRNVPFFCGLELTETWRRELRGETKSSRPKCNHECKKARAALKTLLELIRGNLTAQDASARLKKSGSYGQAWSDPAEIEARLRESGEVREFLKEILVFGEVRLAGLARQVRDTESTVNCIGRIGAAALAQGDASAAQSLADIGLYAVKILDALAEQRPELILPLTRNSMFWPILATVEPSWAEAARQKLENLQFAEDTIHGKLDKSTAYKLESISRRYARGIVETLEKNRCCAAILTERRAIIEAKEKEAGVKVLVRRIPPWVGKAAKLEPFDRNTAESWLAVGMEMLKEQRPNLAANSDWKNIRMHWENRGDKPTPGRLWNSIKDALRSPIRTIARGHKLRKDTQKPHPPSGNPQPRTKIA